MFSELDAVALTHNIVEHGLTEGSVGTIVHSYNNGKAFEVEFIGPDEKTVTLLTLASKDIRLVWSKNVHSGVNYSTRPISETKDEEKYWSTQSYSKPDPDSELTGNYAF